MLTIEQIANLSFGNILSLLILLVLIGFIIIYRKTVMNGLSLFGKSLLFVFQYPAVLIFTAMRFVVFALLDIVILTWFFPEMGWRAFITNPLQKLFSLFDHTFVPGLQYGVIILFVFFVAGILISVATTHYVLARLQQQVEPSPYSINVAMYNMPQILIWSAVYAIVYFGIVTKQLFLLPFMVLLTFFITAAIAQGSTTITNSLIRSVQFMQAAFGQTIVFLLGLGLLELVLGVGTLQKNLIIPVVISSLLTVLITVKDIFKAFVVYNLNAKFNRS